MRNVDRKHPRLRGGPGGAAANTLLLNEAAYSCTPHPHPHLTLPPHHACENLLLGALFNGEALVWEKVAKSWEKGALSRRGREGVNHERTCL